MGKILGILELLEKHGFDKRVPSRLVRHADPSRCDIHALRREGFLDLYQGFQNRREFRDCEQFVVFLSAGRTRGKFIGVYQKVDRIDPLSVDIPPGFPFPEWRYESKDFYRFEKVSGFETLEDRVIVEWGPATQAWVQKLNDKEVVEILPEGHIREFFKDYHEFVLSYNELVQIRTNVEANRDWQARLASVGGVYLILASTTGDQYVGAAYGKEGIWGRWAAYAVDGHGGNAKLQELVRSDPAYPGAFRYSILHVLPLTLPKQEALEWERRYKEKLGTRAFGLNLN